VDACTDTMAYSLHLHDNHLRRHDGTVAEVHETEGSNVRYCKHVAFSPKRPSSLLSPFNQRDQPNPMEADGEQDEEEGLLSEMVGFMWSVFAW
jgi:hypothetical protein